MTTRDAGCLLLACSLVGCFNLATLTSGDSADARAGDAAATGDSGSTHDGQASDVSAGHPVPSLRQSKTVSTASVQLGSIDIALPSPVLAGGTAILSIVTYSSTNSVSAVAGLGDKWLRAAGPATLAPSTGTAEIWYATSLAAGDVNVGVTFAAPLMSSTIGETAVATLSEWEGLRAAPLDKHTQSDGMEMTSFSTPSLTPSLPNELFIAVATTQRYGANLVSGGWAEIDQFSAMSNGYSDAVYLIASGSGAEAASGTQGSGPGESWATVLATFR